jgi:Icc-related predicted phosphoesterase
MKIQFVSDLHLEFAPITITNAGADVLVLAGDILVADTFTRGLNSPYTAKAAEWYDWLEETASQFKYVIYILGNHEHYNGNFYKTRNILSEVFKDIPNLYILDQTWVDINGYRFIGGTLWTDFNHDNLQAMLVRDGLNDYRLIQGTGYKKLTTAETAYYHSQFLELIKQQHSKSQKIVVVGHHAPSYRSVAEQFRYGRNASLNHGYFSHLDRFIEEHPNIKLWIHGHTHTSFDYEIGKTRVMCNPRGYQRGDLPPENRDFNPNLVVEL